MLFSVLSDAWKRTKQGAESGKGDRTLFCLRE